MREAPRSVDPVSGRVISVVLTRRSAGALSELRRTLDQSPDAAVAREPLEAMASLALLVRGNASRAAWGLPAAGAVRLVIDPDLRGVSVELDRELDELLAAIETWLPETHCEWWDPAASGPVAPVDPILRAVDPSPSMNSTGGRPNGASDDANGGEVEVEFLEADASVASADDVDGPPPVVTRDELAMLLDEAAEATSRRPS